MSSSTNTPQPSRHSVVLATLSDNSITKQLVDYVNAAARETVDRVTIVILSERFARSESASHKPSWSEVQDLLTSLYILASKEAQALDKVLLDIEVLLKAPQERQPNDLADADTLYDARTAGMYFHPISIWRPT